MGVWMCTHVKDHTEGKCVELNEDQNSLTAIEILKTTNNYTLLKGKLL